MWSSIVADLERAEANQEPTRQVTPTGIIINAKRTWTPVQVPFPTTVQVAWKGYYPQEDRPETPAVLFIPGERGSGMVYHAVALWLAEHGIPAYAMSLGWQGYSHWASIDLMPLEQVTMTRCLRYHIAPVVRELHHPTNRLYLAGDGVGGILAQLYAREHPDLAGLILLGSCSLHRAASVWTAPVMPHYPSLSDLRATLLDETTSDDQAYALLHSLSSLPPRFYEEYQSLAQDATLPSVPVILIAGAKDHIVPPAVRDATAQDYGIEQPCILPDAPHLIAWGDCAPEAAFHIREFLTRAGRQSVETR
jgi:pimeloyl-ACP methyl ester carboxylesterase